MEISDTILLLRGLKLTVSYVKVNTWDQKDLLNCKTAA